MILASNGIIASSISKGIIPLLDIYGSAAVAYSVRKLRTAYSGSAIRVRRTDLSEINIGFTANGNLDTAALLSFVGTGALDNGFVTTWYDQSGNGINSTQSTATNQPQIVNAGSVILQNGNPCIVFNGSTSNLTNSANSTVPSNISVFVVRSFSSYPSTFRTLFNFNSYGLTYNSSGGTIYANAHLFGNSASKSANDYPTTTGQGLDFAYNFENLERNNFATTLSSIGGYGSGSGTIGAYSGSVQAFLGNIQELVIYLSNKNTDKSGINTNINSYYGIY